MRNTRRIATLGVAVIAAGALFGGTAGAQAEANAFAGGWGGQATADALTITLFGNTITTSQAFARVDGDAAKASATQVLTPAFAPPSVEVTSNNGEGPKSANGEPCAIEQLESVPGLHRVDLTCATADADHQGETGSARGLGAEVVLEPSVSMILETLQLQEPVQGAVNQLFEQAIDPIVEGLTDTPVGELVDATTATLQDVLNDVLSLQSTARIVVAPALAEVNVGNDKIVSHARAQGVRIELLPVDELGATNGLLPEDLGVGEPLITITIGDAEATKTVLRSGADPKGEARASLVTIQLGTTALNEALGLPPELTTITVEPGVSQCVLVGTVLETCVTVAAASVDADGNAAADGTSIQLFKGLPEGGIDIATGRAAVGGAAEAQLPAVEAPLELPRTGGPAVLPIVGGGLLALAAGARRLVRRHS